MGLKIAVIMRNVGCDKAVFTLTRDTFNITHRDIFEVRLTVRDAFNKYELIEEADM